MNVYRQESMTHRALTAYSLVRACWPHGIDVLQEAEMELGCYYENFDDHSVAERNAEEPTSSIAHFEFFLAEMQFDDASGEQTSLSELTTQDLWLVWLEYNANILQWAVQESDHEHDYVSSALGRLEVAMLMASPIWRVQ